MSQKLFTVNDRFYLKPRAGTVIVGDYTPNLPEISVGDEITLLRPDKTKIFSQVSGIEMPLTVSGVRRIAIWVESIKKENVPVGTEVFLKI